MMNFNNKNFIFEINDYDNNLERDSLIEKLSKKALNDDYLSELITKSESNYSSAFLSNSFNDRFLTNKEYHDLLRFTDILCRSSNIESRNLAYKIISLLHPFYKDDETYLQFGANTFSKLGNFPSLLIVNKHREINNIEIFSDIIIKQVYQKSPLDDLIFTDAQFKLFNNLVNHNHFSFSAPTSFGKSFLFQSFILYLLKNEKNLNFVVLVPTKALINQVSKSYRETFSFFKNYKILTHPVVPNFFKNNNQNYIFVFTPERLISYLSEEDNPTISYLLIDEAHKLLSENDSRAPLFYHSLMLAKNKSVKMYFASPNIPNSEIFLELVGNSKTENQTIHDISVTQNVFFLDFIENESFYFSYNNKKKKINIDLNITQSKYDNLFYIVNKINKDDQCIIYCNSRHDTISYAIEYSKKLPLVPYNEYISDLVITISVEMHDQYFLIDCLRKGVAFHFGSLPHNIREKIEQLYQKGHLKIIFCTSTLLEGVNFPAKNIFILSNAIGLKKFSTIDFWNLAGRAGRLTKDISGNIIGLRLEDKRNRWQNPTTSTKVMYDKIKPVKSDILEGNRNFYQNLNNSINNLQFTRKNITENEYLYLNTFANVLSYHALSNTSSILKDNFSQKINDHSKVFQKLKNNNKVPEYIISKNPNIKIEYQNNVLNSVDKINIPNQFTYETTLYLLTNLYNLYNWSVEESKGRKPIAKNIKSLSYYSILISQWINSQSLNYIIKSQILYFDKNNRNILITKDNEEHYEIFNKENKFHINQLINDTIDIIENDIGYKIKIYLKNLIQLKIYKSELDSKAEDIANWDEYLEYGTTNRFIIELQNIGFTRQNALFLFSNYQKHFEFDGKNINKISVDQLKYEILKVNEPNKHQDIIDILSSLY